MINPNFLLKIKTSTFNHSRYITDAMNGFCMQKTDFPFVCCIVDDASTDGEQEVIKKYLEENFGLSEDAGACAKETDKAHVIFAQHKTNENCYFAVYFLKENHFSQRKSKDSYFDEYGKECKYVAFCEGDDYWIDSCKLQKQVDALEAHPGVQLVYTGFKTVDEEGREIVRPNFDFHQRKSKSGDILCRLLRGNFVQTLTMCFRKECLESDFLKNSNSGLDYMYALAAAVTGDVYYLPESMGCYRKTSTGAIATMGKIMSEEGWKVSKYTAREILKGNCKPLPYWEKRKIYFEIAFKLLRYYLKGRRNALPFLFSHIRLYPYILPVLVFAMFRYIESRMLKVNNFR